MEAGLATPQKPVRLIVFFTLAWAPFFILWTLSVLSFAHLPLLTAVRFALFTVGTAIVLAIPVWIFCSRAAWPEKVTFRFYAMHVLAAFIYAIAWNLVNYMITALERGESLNIWRQFATSPTVFFSLLLGIGLYGVVAGVTYSVEIRGHLGQKELYARKIEAAAAAARFDALRARLHPHFLFNALHTVSALIKFDPKNAQAAVERLAELLRYSLREGAEDLVDFEEELQFVREYISFEQLRFGERLKVSFDIANSCADFQLPKFSLQTLIENAVQHSVAVRPSGGSIVVRGSTDANGLTIEVEDDGYGSKDQKTVASDSPQFGLKALTERLATYYGDSAFLRAADVQTGGYCVTMFIPLRKTSLGAGAD